PPQSRCPIGQCITSGPTTRAVAVVRRRRSRFRTGMQGEPRPGIHGLAISREAYLGRQVRCYRDRPPTILDALDVAATRPGDVVGLRTVEGDLRNREFASLVAGAAARLAEAGVEPGDRVAACLRNGLESAVAFFACARRGAVLVALN